MDYKITFHVYDTYILFKDTLGTILSYHDTKVSTPLTDGVVMTQMVKLINTHSPIDIPFTNINDNRTVSSLLFKNIKQMSKQNGLYI